MSNVIPLFPAVTDKEYEDCLMPYFIEAMQILWVKANAGDQEALVRVSESLLLYASASLEVLDTIRRSGYFGNNKLPSNVARAIDNLAADYIEAMGGPREKAEQIRTRLPTQRTGN